MQECLLWFGCACTPRLRLHLVQRLLLRQLRVPLGQVLRGVPGHVAEPLRDLVGQPILLLLHPRPKLLSLVCRVLVREGGLQQD